MSQLPPDPAPAAAPEPAVPESPPEFQGASTPTPAPTPPPTPTAEQWEPTSRRDAVREPLPPSFFRNTGWLRSLLLADGAIALVGFAVSLWAAAAIAEQTPPAAPDGLVALVQTVVGFVATLAFLATATLWIGRQYQLARSTRIHPTARRRDADQQLRGWLVPGLNLRWPLQDTRDLSRALALGIEADGSGRMLAAGGLQQAGVPGRPLIPLWWALWLGTGFLWWISGPIPHWLTSWDQSSAFWMMRALGYGLALVTVAASRLLLNRLDPAIIDRPAVAVSPAPGPPPTVGPYAVAPPAARGTWPPPAPPVSQSWPAPVGPPAPMAPPAQQAPLPVPPPPIPAPAPQVLAEPAFAMTVQPAGQQPEWPQPVIAPADVGTPQPAPAPVGTPQPAAPPAPPPPLDPDLDPPAVPVAAQPEAPRPQSARDDPALWW